MSLSPYVRKGKVSAAVGDFGSVAAVTTIAAGSTVTAGTFLVGSSANSITAHAGGTKAAATVLAAQFNRITVCANADDSVLLPTALAGRSVVVFNDGAAAARVFGAGTDTIDGVATATGVPLTNTKRAIFICLTAGAWISAQLGVVAA
ncbi:hypothetical protein V5F79_22185 [Xanthobacter flavus]|uniref:hypothetical protein n=1 Tax=Xanthobacter flavus TaxID=281 RepID=UPI00372848E4